MKGIVDRIENGIAVCEMDDRQMLDIPVDAFDEQPGTGDVFVYENKKAFIRHSETDERREKVQSLFEKLKKKQ